MIYEMVKGTPPHAELDPLKVMSLITRVQPPRLVEAEGSKDMRDFVASCLRELPGDVSSFGRFFRGRWLIFLIATHRGGAWQDQMDQSNLKRKSIYFA